jgi:hypothetical protein
MIAYLNKLLSKGVVLFLVSGGGLQSIKHRVIDKIDSKIRKHILVAHCSGAEVWGFGSNGIINDEPFYGIYDEKMSDDQKISWREVIKSIIKKYKLVLYDAMSRDKFVKESNGNPLSIMYVDRGPQITLEFTNSVDLTIDQKNSLEKDLKISIPLHQGTYDLRIPIMNELLRIYKAKKLPITPKLGGIFALDNPIRGVDKTFAIDYVLKNKQILNEMNLPDDIVNQPEFIEIWGDKFNQKKGGPDFLMCKAVPNTVRSIDFRQEEPDGIPIDYNIQSWNGEKHLHEGLLEYLQASFGRL